VVVCLAVNLALLCLYHPLALSNSFLSLLLFKMFIPLTAAAVLPLSYRARAPRANCYECFGLLAACVCARVGDSDCSGRFFLSFPYYFFSFHSSSLSLSLSLSSSSTMRRASSFVNVECVGTALSDYSRTLRVTSSDL
jgi:hypothetical protein